MASPTDVLAEWLCTAIDVADYSCQGTAFCALLKKNSLKLHL